MYIIDKRKVFWKNINKETIILDAETGFYFTLNKTGVFIWKLIQQGKNEEEIISEVYERYNISLSQAQIYIRTFLKKLIQEKLIKIEK